MGTGYMRSDMTKQEKIRDEEAREKHRSDWIKAEYETMGWEKGQEIVGVAVESLIKDEDAKG